MIKFIAFNFRLFNFLSLIYFYLIFLVASWMRNNSSCTKMLLLKSRWPNKNFITLFTSNSKFRLNLTQRVTGSLVEIKSQSQNRYKLYKMVAKLRWDTVFYLPFYTNYILFEIDF